MSVLIKPSGAVAAGAQWRRVGTGTWFNGGAGEAGLLPGSYTVEFKSVSGWITPGTLSVTIPSGGTGAGTGVYSVDLQSSLCWGSYLGGSGDDHAFAIAADNSGNSYITGVTASSGWVLGPTPPCDTGLSGTTDAFVVKLDSAGQHVWSTYWGGTADDQGNGIAVDGSGNVYVIGSTNSPAFLGGGWDTTPGGGKDGFVLKLTSAGAPVWSSYLGGGNDETGAGIAVNSSGEVFLTGTTASSGWIPSPTWKSYSGGNDGYVIKLNASGQYSWGSYIGHTGDDQGYSLALDTGSNVYAVGHTSSTSSWVSGGWDSSHNGVYDGYVVRFTASNGAYGWSSFFGGAATEYAYGIAMDSSGNGYITGFTSSSGWVSGGYDTTLDGDNDGFTLKFNNSAQHVWSTYFGGSCEDWAYAIAVDASSACYMTGWTCSSGWVSHGWDTSRNGSYDAFALKLDTAGQHVWSSYLGGNDMDKGYGVAVDSGMNVYVAGETASANWITGGWITTYGGGSYDGFAVKLAQLFPPAEPTTPGATAIGVDTVTWTWEDNSGDETGFKVFDDPSAVDPVTLQTTTAANIQSWQHDSLSANTQYAFQVSATNTYGDSAKTGTITAWTLAAQPLIPSVTNATQHTLDVALTTGDGNPAGTEYAIRVDDGLGGNAWVQADGSVGAAPVYQTMSTWDTITVTGLTANTLYGVLGIAHNGEGIDSETGLEGHGQTLEDVPPTGSVVINNSAAYTKLIAVTLALSADDGAGSGVADMQFSNDNATWSGWEPYAVSKSWGLAPGDGVKTVFVQYRDQAGNVSSAPISDTITLDTAEPVFTGVAATPAVAIVEDEVTITFHASESLHIEPSVTVNGHVADPVSGKDGVDYVYTYTVLGPSQDLIGPAEIEITGEDLAGNFGAATDSSALTIEKKSSVPVSSLPILLVLVGVFGAAGALLMRKRS